MFNRSHSAYSLTKGNHLIGLYEFNTGDARDTSPAGVGIEAASNHTPGSVFSPIAYGNDGIISSGVEFIESGYVGGGVLLDGNERIDFDIDINSVRDAKLTMGGWVKVTILNSYTGTNGYDLARHFLTHENGDSISLDRGVGIDSRGGSIGWSGYRGEEGNGVFGSLAVKTGQWQFVAIVYNTDDDSVLLYVDGITIKSTAKCGKGNTFLSLGKSTVDNVGIQGSVDSVFVYNTCIDPSRTFIFAEFCTRDCTSNRW